MFQVRKPKGWNRFNGNRNDYRDFREKVSVQACALEAVKLVVEWFTNNFPLQDLKSTASKTSKDREDEAKVKIAQRGM